MTALIKRVATYGRRGALVRVNEVTVDGVRRYVVQWGSKAKREQTSFPGTSRGRKEALAYAEGFARVAQQPVVEFRDLTTRELWSAYILATSPNLRPRSIQLYTENWRHWEKWFGAETPANAMTPDTAHQFRARLEAAGLATKTIHSIIVTVRGVYNYGELTEKIGRNRWHQFKFRVAKERRTQPRAEYRQEEFLAIWRQFDPASPEQWRGYVAIGLLGLYGMRQTATLRLAWSDVDREAGTLTFRSQWDKTGQEHVLPLLPLTLELITVAETWRARLGYAGPYLLFPGRASNTAETYSIQSLWSVLQGAERRAGIAKLDYRAGHGFRRGLVGDLLAAGNDMELALKAIGDRDLRMAQHYAIKRNERINAALAAREQQLTRIDAGATKGQSAPENSTAPTSGEEADAAVTVVTTEGYAEPSPSAPSRTRT